MPLSAWWQQLLSRNVSTVRAHIACVMLPDVHYKVCNLWQATLDVGFGRLLHIPKQLSSKQILQASDASSEQSLPAAFFSFEQVVLVT